MALRGWVRNTLAAAVFGLATTAWATAATPTPAPGQYTYTEGGNGHGTLTIKGTSFTLTTIGGNCHTCALEGTIEGGVGVAKDSNGACRITMSGTGSMLTLDSTGTVDACRDFCGARAGFDGEYLRPPAACTDRQRAARIEQSHKQYAAKDYDVARTTLEIGERHGVAALSFGHAGDGNIHSTFLFSPDDPDEERRADAACHELFDLAIRLGGSVSGEHGVGWLKRGQIERQWGPAAYGLHTRVKQAFDPKNLLNPGKKL